MIYAAITNKFDNNKYFILINLFKRGFVILTKSYDQLKFHKT